MRSPKQVVAAAAVGLVLPACALPLPSAEPPLRTQPALEAQEPMTGLPFDDPRLEPVLDELRAHPEWLDEPLDESEILALVPGASEVCLALTGRRGAVFITIEPAVPWRVAMVAVDRGAVGREFTFDPDRRADDICTFVVSGRADPWPADASPIVVQGSVSGDEARAIAQAVHDSPERFGIDRHGVPAVNIGQRIEPGPDGWRCAWGDVFVGGPRSRVVIGTRPATDGWEVETRIVERALLEPEPRRQGHC